tara:strand:- start:398 stop:778 length:381 start_codon:yes stop_codon:yes gene_type:complete
MIENVHLPLCIHNGPYPGDKDRFRCRIAYKQNPSRSFCRDHCPRRVSPQAYEAGNEIERANGMRLGFYPADRSKGWRLGDKLELLISWVTLGQGKRIAKAIARKRGKADCGCQKRKEALNKIGRKP